MPSLAAGFVRDIVEHPDDDAPRLIYADWLQDNGDPERAEFIRLQCARAQLDPYSCPDEREEHLLKKYCANWEKEIPAWARRQVSFQRGFIAHLQCTARNFLKGAAQLFQRAPVQSIEFRTYVERAAELGACPFLGRLRTLNLSGWHGDYFDGKAARAFFRSTHLSGLRTLDLGGCAIGATGMKAVADCSGLAGLTALILNGNGIGPAGARNLAEAPFTNLTQLNLGYNAVGDRGAAALAASKSLRGLRDLRIWTNGLTEAGVRALLGAPWRLTTLSLARNSVGNDGAAHLAEASSLAELTNLELSKAELVEGDGVRALAGSPHLTALTALSLEDNNLGDAGAIALAESPYLANLVRLNLRETGVGDAGVEALLASPYLKRLAFLDLFQLPNRLSKATVARLEARFGKDGVDTFA